MADAKARVSKGAVPKRVLRNGSWQIAPEDVPAKEGKPPAHVVISVKLRREEAEAFRAACSALDVPPNRAFRAMARVTAGYLEVDVRTLDELRTLVRQVSGIATNVNQIARAGNATRRPDYRAFLRERLSLGGQLARLEDLVRRVLDADARRIEGRRRLSRALAEFEGSGS